MPWEKLRQQEVWDSGRAETPNIYIPNAIKYKTLILLKKEHISAEMSLLNETHAWLDSNGALNSAYALMKVASGYIS